MVFDQAFDILHLCL